MPPRLPSSRCLGGFIEPGCANHSEQCPLLSGQAAPQALGASCHSPGEPTEKRSNRQVLLQPLIPRLPYRATQSFPPPATLLWRLFLKTVVLFKAVWEEKTDPQPGLGLWPLQPLGSSSSWFQPYAPTPRPGGSFPVKMQGSHTAQSPGENQRMPQGDLHPHFANSDAYQRSGKGLCSRGSQACLWHTGPGR